MGNLYHAVELKEGELVQYVGCYVMAWPYHAGVEPTIGFVEAEDATVDLLATCNALYTAMLEWSEDLSDTNQEARLALLQEARAAIAKATPPEVG